MLRLAYWTVAATVLGLVAHLATLLFAPSFVIGRTLNGVLAGESNQFTVLDTKAQAQLLPDFPHDSLIGLCRFDLDKGSVTLDASLPDRFWVLAVYSPSGRTLYALNDRQSGANNFSLKLVRAPGLFDLLKIRDEQDSPAASNIDLAWRVASPERKGLAMIWVPLEDQAQRDSVTAKLKQSRCRLS